MSLPEGDVGDLDLGILMVPLGGDAFKRKPKWLGLTGGERRDAEVDCFGIRAIGFQHLHRDVLALGELPHVIFKSDFHSHVRDGLFTCVGDGSIDIADGCSNKILGGAHLEIGKLEVRSVGGRPRCALGLAAKE